MLYYRKKKLVFCRDDARNLFDKSLMSKYGRQNPVMTVCSDEVC